MSSVSPGARPHAVLGFLVASAFLGAMGIGLVNPVVPYLAGRMVADQDLALVVSVLTITYSGAAFVAAPALGALSDRFGRRPVLVLSVFGSAVGYSIFGAAHTAWLLVAARLIDGLTAGNFSAAFAALADVTPAEERGRNFGYMGASVGAGLIAGPALGAILARFGVSAPAYFAAALCSATALFGFFFMPETRSSNAPRERVVWTQLNPFTQLRRLFEVPAIRPLLLVSVSFTIPFAMMTTLLALLGKDRLTWSVTQASTVFVAVGLSDIAVQGLFLGRIVRAWGERRAAFLGLALAAFGLAGMAVIAWLPSGALMFAAVVAFAVGEGIFTACLSALLSLAAGPEAQGRVQGGSQGLQSLTQIAGPLSGGLLYAHVHAAAPFALGALLVVGTGVVLSFTREPEAKPI